MPVAPRPNGKAKRIHEEIMGRMPNVPMKKRKPQPKEPLMPQMPMQPMVQQEPMIGNQ